MNLIKKFARVLTFVVLLAIGCEFKNTEPQVSDTFVVFLDLSISTPKHQHLLDVHFVTNLIARLKPGDEISVLGVTGASFSAPTEIIQRRLPLDPDPFQIEFLRMREKLTTDWQDSSRTLKLESKTTDVLGALAYSSRCFHRSSNNKWLILLSDMRNSVPPVNLEDFSVIPVDACINSVKNSGYALHLNAVRVAALGVHTYGLKMSPQYYESLEMFWQRVLTGAGAELVAFRPDRDWTLNSQQVTAE